MRNGIILASGSAARRRILSAAGLKFQVIPADLDETEIKVRCREIDGDVERTALTLAREKARAVGDRHPDAWTIGADQILEFDGTWYDKPRDRDEAAEHLRRFQGNEHRLFCATAVYRREKVQWTFSETATLRMRDLDDAFIETYLDAVGDDALSSVGAYQLEGRGIQLFDTVSGDFFTILGLPLLPLLAFLRQREVIQ